MIKRITTVLLLLLLIFNSASAGEGMWLLSLIGKNYEQMKAQGFKLTPEDIYNVNHSCIKDGIGGLGKADYPFGFFCSSELVSSKGLVFTNHHCGFEAIQSQSTVEHDYLKDGFWAKKMTEELPIEGLRISYLVRMEDVTDKVLKGITDDMSEEDRSAAIAKASKAIEDLAAVDGYGASVKTMFEGNQYFLFVYITYKDIRLVGAPPSAVGKFGGDTDNWMWPRHTGDFSIFRVYTGPDGKPAEYDAKNIALKPKHYFPVSLKGVKKDDFAMILGFPGSTERYLTSFGVAQNLNVTNPATVEIRDLKLKTMKKFMDADHAIKIQYAAKYAQTANYWKYFIGQSKGIRNLHVIAEKQDLEKQFLDWANADAARKAKYGWVLDTIKAHYDKNKELALAKTYLFEALFQGGEIIMFPTNLYRFEGLLKDMEGNKDLIAKMSAKIKEKAKEYFKDYNVNVDKQLFIGLTKMYYDKMPDAYLPNELKVMLRKKFKGNMEKYANYVFSKTIFADSAKFMAFMDKPNAKVLAKDPAFKLTKDVITVYFALTGGGSSASFKKARRLFIDGLMKMQPDKLFYPDANSTIRLTYGTVQDYYPRDAVHYSYFTTLKGIMEKEDPNNDEFIVPAKLKQLYENKDYGQYADADGSLHVCFLSTNDITGGNSGSVVLNGNGEVIGIAFDGNWEAMSGDIAFADAIQRTIDVDIRYVLFIIDKYAGATNLIDEMTLVK